MSAKDATVNAMSIKDGRMSAIYATMCAKDATMSARDANISRR